MKAEKFILHTEFIRANVIAKISCVECDGKTMVVISGAKSKSVKQRGLQWLWYTNVAESGIGGKYEDTKKGVHLVSKYRWAIPILVRDDPNFCDLYHAWFELHANDDERKIWFVEEHVHTEKFTTSQMAEFLTDFQRYYLDKGVNLADPQDKKLLEWKQK